MHKGSRQRPAKEASRVPHAAPGSPHTQWHAWGIQQSARSHLRRRVCQALEEGRLELRHEGLEGRPALPDDEAQRLQNGGLDLPREAVADDANQRARDLEHERL